MLYIIKVKDFDHYKIGVSKYPKIRLGLLQSSNSFELELIREFENEDEIRLERTIHKFFDHKRIRYEWFKLNLDDIRQIDEMTFNYVSPIKRSSLKSEIRKSKSNYSSLINKIYELIDEHRIGQGKYDFTRENGFGGDTMMIVANILKISASNIRRLIKIHETKPELIKSIDDGELSINGAFILCTERFHEKI
jgi:hypothetical protein